MKDYSKEELEEMSANYNLNPNLIEKLLKEPTKNIIMYLTPENELQVKVFLLKKGNQLYIEWKNIIYLIKMIF